MCHMQLLEGDETLSVFWWCIPINKFIHLYVPYSSIQYFPYLYKFRVCHLLSSTCNLLTNTSINTTLFLLVFCILLSGGQRSDVLRTLIPSPKLIIDAATSRQAHSIYVMQKTVSSDSTIFVVVSDFRYTVFVCLCDSFKKIICFLS